MEMNDLDRSAFAAAIKSATAHFCALSVLESVQNEPKIERMASLCSYPFRAKRPEYVNDPNEHHSRSPCTVGL